MGGVRDRECRFGTLMSNARSRRWWRTIITWILRRFPTVYKTAKKGRFFGFAFRGLERSSRRWGRKVQWSWKANVAAMARKWVNGRAICIPGVKDLLRVRENHWCNWPTAASWASLLGELWWGVRIRNHKRRNGVAILTNTRCMGSASVKGRARVLRIHFASYSFCATDAVGMCFFRRARKGRERRNVFNVFNSQKGTWGASIWG